MRNVCTLCGCVCWEMATKVGPCLWLSPLNSDFRLEDSGGMINGRSIRLKACRYDLSHVHSQLWLWLSTFQIIRRKTNKFTMKNRTLKGCTQAFHDFLGSWEILHDLKGCLSCQCISRTRLSSRCPLNLDLWL